MTPEFTPIHFIDDRVRERLLARSRSRMSRYPLTSKLLMSAIERAIRKATDWRGLTGSYVRAAAEEGQDSMALGFLETGLSDLNGVKGLERLAARLRDNAVVEFPAVASEMRAASELLKEFPGCTLEFPPRGSGSDVIVHRIGHSDIYVEVKIVRDLEVFSIAQDYLGACSLLDPRFSAFFGFSGSETQDQGYESKQSKVIRGIEQWIEVFDCKLVKDKNTILIAHSEGLPEYPFGKTEVKYEWGRFSVAASGIARILTGDDRLGVARELAALDHLARLISAISKAHRQLVKCRDGNPERTDQVRVYQSIPWNLLGLLETHEAKSVLGQIKGIIDAWGISDVIDVRLSSN